MNPKAAPRTQEGGTPEGPAPRPERGPQAQEGGTTAPRDERGAAVIASLTAVSRGVGLARTVVATAVLGLTFLGNTYASTNTTSNLLFDLFAGGALAAVVVPSLAAALAGEDRAGMERTASAFLNTTLLWLTPVVLAGLVLRGPVMVALTSGVRDPVIRAQEQRLGGFLLLAFLPQIWLYGIGLVTTGVLHVHHRFAGPAVAPLLSSIVVGGSYLLYARVEGRNARNLAAVSATGRWILGLGTTAGVLVLALAVVIPAWRLGLRWRPVLRIPDDAKSLTRRLLGSALVAVGMEQLLLGVVLILGNRVRGGVVAYQLAFTLLELPWAILAVPIAIAAFPGLSARMAAGDLPGFRQRSAGACRNLAVLSLGGSAVMLALAGPGTRLLETLGIGGGRSSVELLAPTVAAFAPGLAGYGAYALLTRIAYAAGDGRSPALGAIVGFGAASVLSAAAYAAFSGRALIAALAGAFSLGITAGAGVMLVRLSGHLGGDSFAGLAGTASRGVGAACVATVIGVGAGRLLAGGSLLGAIATSAAVTGLTAGAYLGCLHLLGDRQLGAALSAIRAGNPVTPGTVP